MVLQPSSEQCEGTRTSRSIFSIPWLGSVDVVLQSWFAGMEVGNATANILVGRSILVNVFR